MIARTFPQKTEFVKFPLRQHKFKQAERISFSTLFDFKGIRIGNKGWAKAIGIGRGRLKNVFFAFLPFDYDKCVNSKN